MIRECKAHNTIGLHTIKLACKHAVKALVRLNGARNVNGRMVSGNRHI